MDRLVSSDFFDILSQISDQNFDPEHIYSVFRREMPVIAANYGIVLLKACIYEPIRRSREMNVTKVELLNTTNGIEPNILELEFPTANGGRVVLSTGIKPELFWTEELKEDNYVISRLIFLLVGRAKTMASLKSLMFSDQLTSIPNETRLNQFMGMTLAQGRFAEYCTNFLNIKNMKLINSRFTDEVGNVVMSGYANALMNFATTKGNGIAARLGGDNFLVFIEKRVQEEFIEFAKNIRVPYSAGEGATVKVDSRLGYYMIKTGDGISEAMRNADIASKLARNANTPDVIMFEEYMKAHILKMRQLEQSIPDAVANREFIVHYQPKADISTEGEYKVIGAEALVRWVKDGEMISPNDFIPILEKSGHISMIDYYVLEQVCMDINKWIDMGITPVKVSSNFSRRHLQDPDFADKVEEIIRKHNVDPRLIEIEITESYEAEDMQALKNFENKMHELGAELSVDDFGSGFSSIRLIKNIVADTIKLDKSIIDGVGDNGPDDIILSHIIKMIHSLGKNIIAEGVETEKQAAFLRDNGCKFIQGYLFARPCAIDTFEGYLK